VLVRGHGQSIMIVFAWTPNLHSGGRFAEYENCTLDVIGTELMYDTQCHVTYALLLLIRIGTQSTWNRVWTAPTNRQSHREPSHVVQLIAFLEPSRMH
jgi:hypothetical protein